MNRFVGAVLWLAGALHLLPALGLLGGDRLMALYGVAIADPALLLLMQHRALMFGLLGVLMVAGGFVPALRTVMVAVALASTLGFSLLARSGGATTPALQRVAWIDAALALLLGLALLGSVWRR